MKWLVSSWNTILDSNSLKGTFSARFYMKFFSLRWNNMIIYSVLEHLNHGVERGCEIVCFTSICLNKDFLPFATSMLLHCHVSHKFTHTYCHSNLSILFPIAFLAIKRIVCFVFHERNRCHTQLFSNFFWIWLRNFLKR